MLSNILNTFSVNRAAKGAVLAAVIGAIGATSVAVPAYAWGDREQGLLTGIGATLAIQGLLRESQRNHRPQTQYYYAPAPVYAPAPPPVYVPAYEPSGYSATARAFSNYSSSERRAIQRHLAQDGYYYGPVDGAYGAGTWRAIAAYAADNGLERRLQSTSGAYWVIDDILY